MRRPLVSADFELDDLDGSGLSNRSVFDQTLPRIEAQLRHGKPFFNYVVTWSGHVPFDLSPARPPLFGTGSPLARMANAVHCNTEYVADFVEAIEARDPHAVIAALSDHLPLLASPGGRDGYRLRWGSLPADPAWLETRRAPLVVRKDCPTDQVGLVPQFLLGEILIDLLTDGAYGQAAPCLHRSELIDRPNSEVPVFSTREVFPRPICDRGHDQGDARCSEAQRAHQELHAAYQRMMRAGVTRIARVRP